MSGLEARCVQFHEAALGTGKSKGPAKEIATLRKFLHKNQTQRFSDKAAARLFDTISIYASNAEDGEALLEDALKMPFTVFSTKQKSKMLKWIEERRGADGSLTVGASSKQNNTVVVLTVLDVLDDTSMSLMNAETGDTYENVQVANSELFQSILQAFDETEDAIDVKATVDEDGAGVTVLELVPPS